MPCYRDQQQLDKDIVPKLLPSIAGHCCFQDKETSLIQRGPTRLASASPSGRGVTEGDGEGYTAKHHSGVVMSRSQYPHPAGRHDFSAYLAEKEAKTHSVRSWPLSCFLYRPNKSACVPVLTKYSSVSVCR